MDAPRFDGDHSDDDKRHHGHHGRFNHGNDLLFHPGRTRTVTGEHYHSAPRIVRPTPTTSVTSATARATVMWWL